MRKEINENIVMQYFLEKLEQDEINFLVDKLEQKKEIADLVNQMILAKRINDRIQIAIKLWKALFEVSMSFIDPDKEGYDKIFKYFDEYVEFEELIFASDSFYRDHTLHCLWVYFLTVYIYKNEEFKPILVEISNERTGNRQTIKRVIEEFNLQEYFEDLYIVLSIDENTSIYNDSLMCITSLAHDLGYPIKKFSKINKSMTKILPYFSINTFDDFSFQFDNVQQHYIDHFIDLIGSDIQAGLTADGEEAAKVLTENILTVNKDYNIVAVQNDSKKELTPDKLKILKEGIKVHNEFRKIPSKVLMYSNDFEQYHHGIMSSFLLSKNLSAFQNMKYNYENESLRENDMSILYTKKTILASMADHTRDTFKIDSFSIGSCLTIVDELEEFSRISRASQNREFVEEFCKSYISMEDDWLNIDFEFTNNTLDNLDPEISFKSRCKRFLRIFNIPKLSNNLKIRLRCIGKLEVDNNIYTLEIARKHVDIQINGESQNIPKYLKSRQFYTKEEYAKL